MKIKANICNNRVKIFEKRLILWNKCDIIQILAIALPERPEHSGLSFMYGGFLWQTAKAIVRQ